MQTDDFIHWNDGRAGLVFDTDLPGVWVGGEEKRHDISSEFMGGPVWLDSGSISKNDLQFYQYQAAGLQLYGEHGRHAERTFRDGQCISNFSGIM